MSFDGSGNYTVPAGTQAISGAVIDSAKYNALLTDLQTALTKCLLRDGQSAALAAISMGGFKITSLAPGVLRTDAATLGQVQDSGFAYLSGVAGTNTITANLTPAITAYAAGQTFHFVASGANTGAATINISGIGAKSITKNGTSALATGDILADSAYTLVYDGTQFQLSGSIVSTAGFAQSGANADITSLTALTNGIVGTSGNQTIAGIKTFSSMPVMPVQSMVRLHTANGSGSTNTAIRRFTTTVTSQGTDVTYADSATLGATFTINTNGVYAISYTDAFVGSSRLGLSLNSTQLSTAIVNITTADKLCAELTPAANNEATISWTGYLASGAVVRPHSDLGGNAASLTLTQFTIVRIA